MSMEDSSEIRDVESSDRKKEPQKEKSDVIFHQSSSSKKNPQSYENLRNPYAIFIEDSQSKIIVSKEKSGQKSKFGDVTPLKSVNFLELCDSSQKEFNENELEARYMQIIDQIKNGKYSPIIPFKFSAEENQKQATKFLCYQLNEKNGRLVRYQTHLGTCSSFFRCQGCMIQYSKASALGGHLSKCVNKQYHKRKINGIIVKKQEISEDQNIMNVLPERKELEKTTKIKKKKIHNRIEVKKEKQVLRVKLSQLLANRSLRPRSSAMNAE